MRLAYVGIWVLFIAGIAQAKLEGKLEDLVIEADILTSAQDNQHITAQGNVSISDGEQVLMADMVTYDRATERLLAEGNVRLFGSTGDVFMADRLDLATNLEEGTVEKLKIILLDDSKFAATSATLEKGENFRLKYAAYSPCRACQEDSERPLVWQLKADEVHRDRTEGLVTYKDVEMDFLGMPIFYLPYFSHIDPEIKRKTGLLAPNYGSGGDNIGVFVQTPYYWDLTPSTSVIFKPAITSRGGPVMGLEYDERYQRGIMHFRGSLAHGRPYGGRDPNNPIKRGEQLRGFGHLEGVYNVNDNWRFLYEVNRASDQTYIRRYGALEADSFDRSGILVTDLNAEGFYGKNYATIHSYAFQAMQAEVDSRTSPLVLPAGHFSYMSDPVWRGSFLSADFDAMGITRQVGSNVGRLSSQLGWHLPGTTPFGLVYRLDTELRGDFYQFTSFRPAGSQTSIHDTRARALPSAAIEVKYPFVSAMGKDWQMILEPVVGSVITPNRGNSVALPNEDSQDFELEPTNLFKATRFPGLDLLDTGQRVNYGFNVDTYRNQSVFTKAFLGQSYSFSENPYLPKKSGINQGQSDYVGKLSITPTDNYELSYLFRLDHKTQRTKRSQVHLEAGPAIFHLASDYIFVDQVYLNGLYQRQEQVSARLSSQFTKFWRVGIHGTRNLGKSKQFLSQGISLTYQDECFTFDTRFSRNFYADRDFRKSDTIIFTASFKNLGSVSTGPIRTGEDVPPPKAIIDPTKKP